MKTEEMPEAIIKEKIKSVIASAFTEGWKTGFLEGSGVDPNEAEGDKKEALETLIDEDWLSSEARQVWLEL